ncbi:MULTISPECIES: calcium-binding protein [unclassified Herbaspirillum]|uniref:beta strand repeat-containing protein n=1 Tax=unclassified Herbaspirillum TaxID=2624150 RepID=UPI001F3154D2|nr:MULTISPECIES: calcium-binding protein [unclassified Herbaspirillum]
MATAAPAKVNPANSANPSNAANAAQAITGSASVAMPDQNGSFHLNVPRGAVKHVQVVDVDMVLQLTDGSKVVLAGGAMGAMDEKSKIVFADTSQDTGRMLDLVGKIPLRNNDQSQILNSDPVNSQAEGSAPDNHFNSNNNSAQVNPAATSQLAKIIQDNAGSLTSNGLQNLVLPSIPVPPAPPVTTGADSLIKQLSPEISERAGSVLTPIVVGPQTPAMTLNLLNLTTTTQVGSVLFGSGGSPASATDGSNSVQFATQVINAGNDVHTIYATGSTTQSDFIKIFKVNVTGDGTVKSVLITGVPSNMTILNATNLGGGSYQITPTAGEKSFDLQVQYTTTAADPTQPTAPTATINFDVSVLTTDGLTHLLDSRVVVIKDASSYTDLTYLDPATGKSVWVLPAQGVPHEIHAGDGGVTIYGSNANDLLYGGAGADTIIGGSGNTYFEGGAGADVLTGGTQGINTAGYKNSAAGVTIDLATGLGTGGDAQGDVLSNIQNLIGSAFNDTFVASDKVNRLDGGSGGVDTVSYANSTAGVTVNLITGLGSNGYAEGDTYVHIQNATGSAYNDMFIANTLANRFDGGSGGSDTVSYASSAAGVTVNLSTGAGTGGSAQGDTYVHIQNVIGSAFNDTFVGNIDANSFDGGSGGQDTVSYANSAVGVSVNFVSGRGVGGDAEGDTYSHIQNVIGSAHDDVFVAGIDSRVFNGGSGGSDTVNYGASTGGIIANMVTMTGSGGYADNNTYVNIQNIVGSSSGDIFISGAGANHFDGGSGGSDTVSYASSNAGVTVSLFDGSASGGYAQGDTLLHIQNVIGGAYDDLFIASADNNRFDGGGGVNTVSYEKSVGGVTVDLTNSIGTGTGSTYANGDSFVNIQNLIGSIYDDIFIASADANKLEGGTGSAHNRVSYENSNAAVTVDLNYTDGTGTSGGYAAGDKLSNIQDLTGSSGNDTFVASNVANNFDGGAGSNTVSYAASNVGVTIDLVLGGGNGGYATGDAYTRIQNIIGSAGDDMFIANGDANRFDGGGGTNTVSYAKASDSIGVVVDLVNNTGSNGFAAGDTYANIQNVIGSTNDDTFIASSVTNVFDGLQGSDTVSYVYSTAGVTVNLVTGLGANGYAASDTYANIENIIGSSSDDLFVASADANTLDGGVSTAASHNRVSYASSTTGVTVDLSRTDGVGTSGGYAAGDKLSNIQDLTGSAFDDTFVASAAANNFDGGTSTSSSHNRVSYTNSTVAETVDLFLGTGSGGAGSLANGDTYTNIQDVTGGAGNDIFIASAAANKFDGSGGTHNLVSYVNSTVAETVDLFAGTGAGGAGSLANGDTYTNIQDVTGGSADDTFVASAAANKFDGGGGTHNRVSYANSAVAVTVDLVAGAGTGGLADLDTYTNIQDVTGGAGDDTFVASAAANKFDGGGGTHNRVNYATSAAAVTVNLFTGNGTGGLADLDTYTNIQDVTGGLADDIFVASAAANKFDGGGSNHNLVSYANSAVSETVDLVLGTGSGGAGSLANGDTYTNIQDVTGGSADDTFIASAAANKFDGGGGTHNRVSYANSAVSETVDLFLGTGSGGVGSLAAGDTYTNIQDVTGGSGDDIFIASLVANKFDGGNSTSTSHNLVSYVNSTVAETVDLFAGTGTGGAGSLANGDTYTNIQDVLGGSGNDTFIASAAANKFDGGASTAASHNRVSYANSAVAEKIDLFLGVGTGGAGSLANNDTYANIQDATGGSGDDTFVGSAANNNFDGGASTATSHNRVDYSNSAATVTVNLVTGVGVGGLADGDTYTRIQDVTGGSADDLFVASLDGNKFDGGASTATSHNRVSYASSTSAETVNLFSGAGSGTYAANDTYTNIQDVTGGTGDDIFFASAAANNFDGGTSTATSHNRVDYSNSTVAETVDLFNGVGSGGAGSLAAGDTYTNIQDATGGTGDDIFIASAAANKFDGGTGSDTVSYAVANDGNGVNVNLNTNVGTGGFAANDVYASIENVIGTQYNDTFVGNASANTFNGGLGSDTVSYTGSSSPVTVNLSVGGGAGSGGNAQGDTYISIENVIGGSGADTLTGATTGATVLTGAAGGDTLAGVASNRANTYASYAGSAAVTINLNFTDGTGTSGGDAAGDKLSFIDNLIGSDNDDIFIVNGQANNLNGGLGSDTVSYISSDGGVTVNLSTGLGANFYAQGDVYTSIENVIGSTFADTLTGANTGKTVLTGGSGGDTLTGVTANRANTYASYAGSATGVIVDLNATDGTGTSGGDAAGDKLSFIDNLIGSSFNDTFVANGQNNSFDGGAGGVDTVSYLASNAAVIVDLSNTTGAGTSGGYAGGDKFTGISNIIGSNFDDTFFASSAANFFNGSGKQTAGDTVSYARSGIGVAVDLYHNTGGDAGATVSFAHGDTYANIQNAVGSTGNDIFYGNGDANTFTGGGGVDTVSYLYAGSVSGSSTIIANLGSGVGTGGDANGDKYFNIANLEGSSTVDSQLTGDSNANVLTVQGLHTTNTLSGGGAASGTDVFNVVDGGSNSVAVGAGLNTINVSAGSHSSLGAQSDMVNQTTGVSNISTISGGAGTTTLHFADLGSSITLANFSNKVTGITTLDMTSGSGTNIVITADDVIKMGMASGATSHILTVKMSSNESLQIAANGSDHYVYFPGTTDYAFYNASNVEVARIHLA